VHQCGQEDPRFCNWEISKNRDTNEIRIAHPKAIAKVCVEAEEHGSEGRINYVGDFRTARAIMMEKAILQLLAEANKFMGLFH
jgi:uncharacterized Fe-S radical SAM superfamily protein PflX